MMEWTTVDGMNVLRVICEGLRVACFVEACWRQYVKNGKPDFL